MGIELIQGDITRARVDALVNAANSQLMGGGGVDGAIHKAAGPKLLAAGRDYVRAYGPLAPGKAMMTPGFELPASYVIHTVGPIWQGGHAQEASLLASCYRESLAIARQHGLTSIVFSAISCGVYGYPHDQAAEIALSTLLACGPTSGIKTIQVCLFSQPMFALWQGVLTSLSPLTLKPSS
ncbi:MAG: O-acetyl-ADP-ribose deacetylase [Deltaproteobacteria bacterium]|nr:MAG: O-acetyl-ADP-ribose deacetylase [Deltaproteobacteria bacterium]